MKGFEGLLPRASSLRSGRTLVPAFVQRFVRWWIITDAMYWTFQESQPIFEAAQRAYDRGCMDLFERKRRQFGLLANKLRRLSKLLQAA